MGCGILGGVSSVGQGCIFSRANCINLDGSLWCAWTRACDKPLVNDVPDGEKGSQRAINCYQIPGWIDLPLPLLLKELSSSNQDSQQEDGMPGPAQDVGLQLIKPELAAMLNDKPMARLAQMQKLAASLSEVCTRVRDTEHSLGSAKHCLLSSQEGMACSRSARPAGDLHGLLHLRRHMLAQCKVAQALWSVLPEGEDVLALSAAHYELALVRMWGPEAKRMSWPEVQRKMSWPCCVCEVQPIVPGQPGPTKAYADVGYEPQALDHCRCDEGPCMKRSHTRVQKVHARLGEEHSWIECTSGILDCWLLDAPKI
eukprot:1161490-Pelagomonas_calceolata.AAC.8